MWETKQYCSCRTLYWNEEELKKINLPPNKVPCFLLHCCAALQSIPFTALKCFQHRQIVDCECDAPYCRIFPSAVLRLELWCLCLMYWCVCWGGVRISVLPPKKEASITTQFRAMQCNWVPCIIALVIPCISLILQHIFIWFFNMYFPTGIVGKKRDPGILDPELFLAQIRKVEARLGKLAKIRKVETG